MNSAEQRINDAKSAMGKNLLILAHLYQRPEVVAVADGVGDSLELARLAAREKNASKIAFCGVKFMAESADILSGPHQTVYMPDTAAGCPMSDMADEEQVLAAWKLLCALPGPAWIPVVYVNSSAAVKSLCGQWGGSACTSSNAGRVMKWALDQHKRVLFLPDEHLGTNTAVELGLSEHEIAVIDPSKLAGLTAKDWSKTRVAAWKGYCHVHTAFTEDDITRARTKWPECRIIVHPETPRDVLKLADAFGSTAQIIQYVEKAPQGSVVVIGTEFHLVERLARQYEGRKIIKTLRPSLCPNMHKTSAENLADLLESWPRENEIHVSESVAVNARKALEKMLTL